MTSSPVPVVIPIQWPAIHSRAAQRAGHFKRFFRGVVAEFAHRLPVFLVPEELMIAAVRLYVIDDRRSHEPAHFLAHHAIGMLCQKICASLTPLPVVQPAHE